MEFLSVLWLPILLSAGLVFVMSAIIHMLIPYHKSDYKKIPEEDSVLERLGKAGITPGHYAFPRATSMKQMGDPDMVAKFERGPVGFMTILPSGKPTMGKSLTLWFLFSAVISAIAAYLAWAILGPGPEYLTVFRLTGTVAFVGYGWSHISASIWTGMPWSATLKHVFDGFIYSLLTAGAFGWLWPGV